MKSISMYIKAIVLVCMMTISVAMSSAAEIKPQKATFDDYIPLLESAGYHVYSFDIKSMTDRQYNMTFSIREYEGDSLVNKNILFFPVSTKNMTLLSDFSEEDQAKIRQKEMYDSSRKIHSCAEKIVVGTYAKNDSTTKLIIDVDNMMKFDWDLNLKPQVNPTIGENQYLYLPKPFKTGDIKLDEFIPLVFYGSFWYDPDFNVFRFCGDYELNPDMSNQLIKDVPHSYVVGLTISVN